MFDKIIAYSIKHKLIVGIAIFALLASGIYSLQKLPIDALPDITNNQVQIITTSKTLSTQEVELYLTYPIELAVKSIPEIVELRSISRFGLSLVTVVFEEDTDIYWARNQITERLKEAQEEIPEHLGTPELAPISTGLGEIYQYTVQANEQYKDQYNAADLRTIQDWNIAPQLLGIKGVVEVNTLGGHLKEYEVAVNPDKLKSMDITMIDIYEALQSNNANTGGAYIDKKPNAYFIRSLGVVNSLDDISKIVVKVKNDIPILIRDVANVQYGKSVRYGATTKDGEGEVVSGMVMMLKGENSAAVAKSVKKRIEQIKETLPEGVEIHPFLDRTKLVDRAISTVRTNLIEGALIVIFILVLLIGNWRAGLIVASVIPLSLLFAVNMMRFFEVSGNLMSLGAIDFGLIVDGAVIIVEAIVHRLYSKSSMKLTSEQMDKAVYTAASGIRKSAAFGEIIILIVYLPILALVGIEGKMFIPMAQTVSFAILGAFILSLTYVPMMSALFLSKNIVVKTTLSDRIVNRIYAWYKPILDFSLRYKKSILAGTIILFIGSVVLFNSLGGEFIPTLEEGDIATHVIIPPGSSLDQEIETTTKAERILLSNFPEIEQIVSKIGSAEVPTDPMPMEVADMMVILKPKNEWVSASSRQELSKKMEAKLEDLPGVTTEFTQPIQMRFNELMTGIRSDVGIKVFGDDIDLLVEKGQEIVQIINQVNGVEDARAETVTGLPQITIDYDKDKLALYGLNIDDLNAVVTTGFAGSKAGVVYEGEKKFDLMVRLDQPYRQTINHVRNLYVSLPSGNQIPLSQVADIDYQLGPAQISREQGKRRIIIGLNVRGRDVETTIQEIQTLLKDQIDLPPGYYFEYAGQFENLKTAKNRLLVAVPIALLLIFVLLYFTFSSFKQSIMIFTAIPLSAIGGILALWLRDMPFSISAGIGFIALFGVAVLNGIVLISYFNTLKNEGMDNIVDRIFKGTAVRLRPVIMTASVASLGFLPMALSTNAGAEVQKPLATVVIGGLITATLLTLVILPILYYYSEKVKLKFAPNKIGILLFPLLMATSTIEGQDTLSSLPQLLDYGFNNHPVLKGQDLDIQQHELELNGAYALPPTSIESSYGQINSNEYDHAYGIRQEFDLFSRRPKKKLAQSNLEYSKIVYHEKKADLTQIIRKSWNKIGLLQSLKVRLEKQVVIYQQIEDFMKLRYENGDCTNAQFLAASSNNKHIIQKLAINKAELEAEKTKLKGTLLFDGEIQFTEHPYEAMVLKIEENNSIDQSIAIQKIEQQKNIIDAESAILKSSFMPSFDLGYNVMSIKGFQNVDGQEKYFGGTPQFHSFSIGLQLPLSSWMGQNKNLIQSSRLKKEEIKTLQSYLKSTLDRSIEAKIITIQALNKNLKYYETSALQNATIIEQQSLTSFKNGDIGQYEYLQILKNQYNIHEDYLKTIFEYNEEIIEYLYIINQ